MTHPNRIWLQLDTENGQPLEDATWRADQIEDYDTPYISITGPTLSEARDAFAAMDDFHVTLTEADGKFVSVRQQDYERLRAALAKLNQGGGG